MVAVNQVSSAMSPGSLSFQLSRWGRGLALLLVGALLLQTGPLRGLVQSMQHTVVEKQCRHHANQEVCPRNPEGPCTCMHHDTQDRSSESESPVGPVFEACNGGGTDALSPSISPLGWTPVGSSRPAPHVTSTDYAHSYRSLSPQRVGDDVFRPPRTTPPVRVS